MKPQPVRSYVIAPLRNFLRTEASGGMVLFVAMVVALLWANGPFADSYHEVFEDIHIGGTIFGLHLDESLHLWINDGLMTIFFFVVGLEIKRELVTGELREPRRAAVPVLAALGGMIGPAAVYLILNTGTSASHGWGIPMATDIAFAVGVLTLLGSRVPSGLKVFLLTLAIVDDIGGIAVIAIFYTSDISLGWIVVTLAAFAATVLLRVTGAARPIYYIPIGAVVWFAALESGIHPTIAGVALGLLTPARPVKGRPVLEELEHRLHPISSFVIVPLFALANAGVALDPDAISEAFGSPVFWGIAGGLLGGKMLGIGAVTALTVKLGIGKLPTGVRGGHVVGVSALAGIGFTVALFIAGLAFVDHHAADIAKVGVLFGSVAAGVIGAAILRMVSSPEVDVPETPAAAPGPLD